MNYFTIFILSGFLLITDGGCLSRFGHRWGGNRDGDKDHEAKGKNGEGFHGDICVSTSLKQ